MELKQWSRAILYRLRQQWVRNHLARNDAARREEIGWALRARLTGQGTVIDDVQSRLDAERARLFFERLRPHEQFIIRLRVLEDRQFAEIGALTERAEDAARMAYRRAIRRLRSLYEAKHEA